MAIASGHLSKVRYGRCRALGDNENYSNCDEDVVVDITHYLYECTGWAAERELKRFAT